MGSWYRIKDNHITQINRNMPQAASTINVTNSAITQNQQHPTTQYTVYYFPPKDRSLKMWGVFLTPISGREILIFLPLAGLSLMKMETLRQER